MAANTTFVFGRGAAKAEIPSAWRVISDDAELVEFSPDDHWCVPIAVDSRIYQVPLPVTEKDIPQFFDRNVLVPCDIIVRRNDGEYYTQYLNRSDGRVYFLAAYCRQIGETEVRRLTLTYSKPEDAEVEQTILDFLYELGRATTITSEFRRLGEKLDLLETRLVAPFYEVLFEVPWDWIYEWSEESELPLYYRDEEGTGTLQVQVDSFVDKGTKSDEMIESVFRDFLEKTIQKLGHDSDSAIPIPNDAAVETSLFKRIDPDYEDSRGTEVSVKWTRFTRFARVFSVVNFDFLVSKEQYALPRVQKELELLHEGIVRARVRPPKADRET